MAVEAARSEHDRAALRAIQEQAQDLRSRREADRVAAIEKSELFDAQMSDRRGGGHPLFVDILA